MRLPTHARVIEPVFCEHWSPVLHLDLEAFQLVVKDSDGVNLYIDLNSTKVELKYAD